MPKTEEDVDIYGDLPEFTVRLNGNLTPIKETIAQEKPDKLKKQVVDLSMQLESVRKMNKNLEVNLSSLLKTAKAEIARKDKTINDLRQQLDNLMFKRKHGKSGSNNAQPDAKPNDQHVEPLAVIPQEPPASSLLTPEYLYNHNSYDNEHEKDLYHQSSKHSEMEEGGSGSIRVDSTNRGCSTVYGKRLLKKLTEQDNLERRKKKKIAQGEIGVEYDRENSAKKQEEVAQVTIAASNVSEESSSKREDVQKSTTPDLPLSQPRSLVKRSVEREENESYNKRVRREDEFESFPEATVVPSHSKYETKSRHHKSSFKPRHEFVRSNTYDRREKYREFDGSSVHHEEVDFFPDNSYSQQFAVKHVRKDRRSVDNWRSPLGDMVPEYASTDHTYVKMRNDHRYDTEHSNRRWINPPENYHANNPSDRRAYKKSFPNERGWNNKYKRNSAERSDREYDFRQSQQEEKFRSKETYGQREYDKKRDKKSGTPEDNVCPKEKYPRRKSFSNPNPVKGRRRRSGTYEDPNPEPLQKWNENEDSLHRRSRETTSEELKRTDYKEEIKDDIKYEANIAEVEDKLSRLEEGEISDEMENPEVDINLKKSMNFDNVSCAIAKSDSTEDLKEKETKSEQRQELEESIKTNVEIEETESKKVVNIGKVEEGSEIPVDQENLKIAQSEPSVNNLAPENSAAIEFEGEKEKIFAIPEKTEISEQEVVLIGIFGDEKDSESLTAEITRERENNRNMSTACIVPDQVPIDKPVINTDAADQNPVGMAESLQDSIEKKLERLENSVTDSPNVSSFFRDFKADIGTEPDEIADEKAEPQVEVETEQIKDLPAVVHDDQPVQPKLLSASPISSCSSSSSSSSSSSCSSSSSLSTSSSSSASEKDDIEEKERIKDNVETLPISQPVEIPSTNGISADACNTQTLEVRSPRGLETPSATLNVCSAPSDPRLEDKDEPSSTQVSAAKSTRKIEPAEVKPLSNVKGKVVIVVRRRRPVRLSNTGSVTVITNANNSSVSAGDTNNIGECTSGSKPRACKAPRSKNA